MRVLRRVRLYTRCFFTVSIVRLALWMTKYQKLRMLLVRSCHEDPQTHRKGTVIHTLRAVDRVARLIPDASCLTQSIAGQALLSWQGIPSRISMGVMKTPDGSLEAHAWLVWNEVVVLQGDQRTVRKYRKIMDLPTPPEPLIADV